MIQLLFNGFWPHIFFGAQQPGLAFTEIILLFAATILTTLYFFEKEHLAGWLMVPYIFWIVFATVLNGAIWMMN